MNAQRSDRSDHRLVLTGAAQRAVDAAAEREGIPSTELMESAGTGVAEWMLDRLVLDSVLVLVGPGGNGGDGLVVARKLHEAEVDVDVLLVPDSGSLRGATQTMWERLPEGVRRISIDSMTDDSIEEYDWIVDGLFGTGLTRPLEGAYRDLVERMGGADGPILSLDLPSGLSSDAGGLLGPAIRARITLALAFLKPAHLAYPAADHCGNVAVTPVAYPDSVLGGVQPHAHVPEGLNIARRLPPRDPTGHKGTFGRVLVLAGSSEMTGAALLTCRGALRAGAGLVHLAAPTSVRSLLEGRLPEAISIEMPEEEGRLASLESRAFADLLERADAVAIGPGLGRSPATRSAVRAAVERFPGPIVLDADGLYAYEGKPDDLLRAEGSLVLTPHPGEFAALTGLSIDRVDGEAARALAARIGAVVLLKGRPTSIALPDGALWLNPTGNDGLATGGSGDILTGLIAGFLAGAARAADAAVAAAYVHGRAAEVFARDRASRSLTPTDVLDLLPYVIREVEREAAS